MKNTAMTAPAARPFADPLDWLLFVLAIGLGTLFAVHIHANDIALLLVDQFSHLSIARQITDSLTPGMSQVGFWPPLLHILLAPFAAIDALYYSGYASAVLLLPLLAASVVYFARLLFLVTEERFLSYTFASTLLLNPYVFYFSITPMMEMLFLAMLIATAYYFARWWLTSELSALVLAGVFVSLSTLARFEGFILLPLLGSLILYRLIREHAPWSKMEALIFIFGLMATTGIVFTLIYGAVYNDNPLAFMSNSWGAQAQQRDLDLPAAGSVIESVRYMGTAAMEILGRAPIMGMLAAFVFLLVTLIERRMLIYAVIAIFVSPFLFDVLATYQGSAVVYLPQLPPFPDGYFNVRYGLFLAAATITIPMFSAALIAKTFYDPRRSLPLHLLPVFYVFVFVIVGGGSLALATGCTNCFQAIERSLQSSPADHAELTTTLREHYDGGFILMTRALHNETAVRAGIPLNHYILEANEHYYGRAVETPWLYARYVIMFNPNEGVHQEWQRKNEAISRVWADNPEFLHFYEALYLSDSEALYRVREPVLREYLLAEGIPPEIVPALWKDGEHWDVGTTHERIEAARAEKNARETALNSDGAEAFETEI